MTSLSLAAEIAVDGGGAAAAFVDSPDDQRLPAATVAGGEDPVHAGAEITVGGTVVRALVDGDADRFGGVLLGAQEAHGKQDQVGGPGLFGTGHLAHAKLPLDQLPFDFYGFDAADIALPVVDSDEITVTYESPFRLMHDLRGMAETNMVRQRLRRPSRSALFMRAAELYLQRHATDDGRIRATFRILTMTGWAPAPVQQAPLRPGSARVSLADALGGSGPGERG